MYIDFSGLFHQSSKDLTAGGTHFIPADQSLWPAEWKTTHYKRYNLDKISLTDTTEPADLFEIIRTRKTSRQFEGKGIEKAKLSTLLKYSCGIVRETHTNRHRAQPSGGSRYPIEIYPVILNGSEDIPAGIYHYDVKEHALDVLKTCEFSAADISSLMVYDFAKQAACVVIMTAVFSRTQIKYGERGYRYMVLEAGHIGQNLYLVSNALRLNCCAMGGTLDSACEKLIEIDGVTESVLYGLLIG